MTHSVVKIKDVCDFYRGLTYSKSDEVDFSGNAVLRATNIDLITNKLNLSEIKYINDAVNINQDKKVQVNDILICTASGSKSHLGKVAFIEEPLDMAFGGFMGVLRAKPNTNPKFLFAFLKSDIFLKHVFGLSDGANINNLKFSQFENLEFNLPSLSTQQKIVEKLDAIFAEINKATAAAEANVKNAEALYMAAVNKIFNDASASRIRLGDKSNISYGYTAKAAQLKEGVSYLRITDIQNDSVNWSTVPKIDGKEDLSQFILKEGDIVFARTGATTGKSYLVKNPPLAVFASYLIRVDLDREQYEPAFLKHYFMSREYWRHINLGISGAAQGGFNATKLSELSVPFLNKQKQLEVIGELDNLYNFSRKLALNYQQKLADFLNLRNSILDLAFSGKLV